VDSATTTTFVYNGDGLRDSLTFDSTTTTFTWDVNRPIPQVLDDGTYQYLYGVGRIAQVGASETHYYLTDGLGSTLALTDEAGDIVNTYDYDVFGGLRDETGSQANDFTFAGEQVDASTGLQYLRARYYDVEAGRFVSRDPHRGLAEVPETQHRFVYVLNLPTTLTDPSGNVPTPGPFAAPKEGGTDARFSGCSGSGLGGSSNPGSFFEAPGSGCGGGANGGGGGGTPPVTPRQPPRPSPNFQPPTHAPQPPPSQALPPNHRLRIGEPTPQYPNGYWRIEKWDGRGWQGINPRTMKPGPHPDTHIPLPPGFGGGGTW
jgi:RHS repeat-associated protein